MSALVRRSTLLLLFASSAVLLAASAPTEIIQPVESRRDLVLVQGSQRTHIEVPGSRRQRVPLHGGERVTEVAELRNGWAVAGTREAGDRRQLFVMSRDGGGFRRLPGPVPSSSRLQLRPALLVGDGRLNGVAWLEGDGIRSMAVRAAGWSGSEWDPAAVVSPPGPGSQTGLTGVELEDGSWLLVWAAFDGRDDEILWSHGDEEGWSEPLRLGGNNQVPDVTPTLMATDRGALLAWSRYDGRNYRVMFTRYEDGEWMTPRMLGPSGSLRPRFLKRSERTLLSFRNALPAAWSVVELEQSGRILRGVTAPGRADTRPVVSDSSSWRLTLRWPTERDEEILRWEPLP